MLLFLSLSAWQSNPIACSPPSSSVAFSTILETQEQENTNLNKYACVSLIPFFAWYSCFVVLICLLFLLILAVIKALVIKLSRTDPLPFWCTLIEILILIPMWKKCKTNRTRRERKVEGSVVKIYYVKIAINRWEHQNIILLKQESANSKTLLNQNGTMMVKINWKRIKINGLRMISMKNFS